MSSATNCFNLPAGFSKSHVDELTQIITNKIYKLQIKIIS